MNFLEKKIKASGAVKPGSILKVDSFLNHQTDIALVDQIAREFRNRFADCAITKVLTIETSGIPIACSTAREFGVPMVFAKKSASINVDGDLYVAEVTSFNQKTTKIMVAKKFLSPGDRVLIVDDIMANGCALQGLIALVEDAEATVVGCGIAIEKSFQEGGHRIRNLGYRLESIAIVDAMDADSGTVTFRSEE